MPIYPYEDQMPRLGKRVFIAPTAIVAGDVELGDDVSIWFGTVARGDVHYIRVGAETNIQDGCMLHVSYKTHPLLIGKRVVVGHHAVLHGCTIGDGALIGIGARVLDGAVVEPGAQVAAGALVAPGKVVPAGQLVMGAPAKPVRPLSDEEKAAIGTNCDRYRQVKDEYLRNLG